MDPDRPAMSRRVAVALSIPPLVFLALFFVWPVVVDPGDRPRPRRLAGHRGHRGRVGSTVAAGHHRVHHRAWRPPSPAARCSWGCPRRGCSRASRSRAERVLRALFAVPFVLPTVVVAAAFLALLGPRSALNQAAGGQPLVARRAPPAGRFRRPRWSSRACSSTSPSCPAWSAGCGRTSTHAWRRRHGPWAPARGVPSAR